eukprot:1360279-Prymnesium_polylepis.2
MNPTTAALTLLTRFNIIPERQTPSLRPCTAYIRQRLRRVACRCRDVRAWNGRWSLPGFVGVHRGAHARERLLAALWGALSWR